MSDLVRQTFPKQLSPGNMVHGGDPVIRLDPQEMKNWIYMRYLAVDAQVPMDLTHGYIHVSAGSDGTMNYETSR